MWALAITFTCLSPKNLNLPLAPGCTGPHGGALFVFLLIILFAEKILPLGPRSGWDKTGIQMMILFTGEDTYKASRGSGNVLKVTHVVNGKAGLESCLDVPSGLLWLLDGPWYVFPTHVALLPALLSRYPFISSIYHHLRYLICYLNPTRAGIFVLDHRFTIDT